MAVTRDIPRAWLRPRRVVTELLAGGPSDRVAFVYLAAASVLGFVAQLPALVRRSREIDPELDARIVEEAQAAGMVVVDVADTKFEALMSGALMGWIFIVPLLMYGLAWILRGVAHLLGGRGTGLRVRVALFFSFLAITPALLLLGLTSGFVGPGPAETAVGVILVCGFIWISLNALYAAETPNA
ncbi:YIP1 family protein [Jannaschia formosa]|uniref:YIP1 family protein n=1 Tax=Jannaschia formosa TaxID=2259592 RepID=UPI000E1C1A3A|nr:YIP1 family protein [Jannaschia formosa]TFL18231.1 YIP1 family protein [Jannaschia formosa]